VSVHETVRYYEQLKEALENQADSKLSRWYQQRFAQGSSRVRRIGIVALARKLLIELWRYLETGIPPEGAVLHVQ